MTNKRENDKKTVLVMLAICVVAILVFTFGWSKEFFMLAGRAYFIFIYVALLVGFVVVAFKAYQGADDPNKDKFRYLSIAIAVAVCIWAAMHTSDLRAKINDGIAPKYGR